jgi:hypothetical protein
MNDMDIGIEALKRIESLEAELAEAHADNAALDDMLQTAETELAIALGQMILLKSDMTYSEVLQ